MTIFEYIVLAGFAVLFIWGWWRVYKHVIRKGGQPFVAHLLGVLLAFFPARFFVMAVTALTPIEGRVPLSDTKTIILWLIFILSVLGMHFLTRKKEFRLSSARIQDAEEKARVRSGQQKEWKEKTLAYAEAINEYVDKGIREGWDKAGERPDFSGREHLVDAAIEALREANENSEVEKFREEWPPAFLPFSARFEESGQSIPVVCMLHDESILARICAPYNHGRVVHIRGDRAEDVPGVEFFGFCPNKQFFAVAEDKGVCITAGWMGPRAAFCPWPDGSEDIPDDFTVVPWKTHPRPTKLVVFPDGKRVLLVSKRGIYVMSPNGAHRLEPTAEELRNFFSWTKKEYPDNELHVTLSMEHGAISKNGKYIAVGAQDGKHLIFDADLKLIGQIGPHNEHPHYAIFSSDDEILALNACYFDNGTTIGVPTMMLNGLDTAPYEEKKGIFTFEDDARIYAGIGHKDEFITGNAYGYIRACGKMGEYRWHHLLGSRIDALDISDDGKKLVVSTHAGFVTIIELHAGNTQPYVIGTGNHHELCRWIFWKGEKKPLMW